jgi:invasion protein IalB
MRSILAIGFCALVLVASAGVSNTETVVGTKFGDWTFNCRAVAEGRTNCSLVQNITGNNGKATIGRVTINHIGDGNRMIISLPLGMALSKPVVGQVDEAAQLNFTAYTCLKSGCLYGLDLDDVNVKALKAGKELKVAFTLSSALNRTVGFTASLAGLTKAFGDMGWDK